MIARMALDQADTGRYPADIAREIRSNAMSVLDDQINANKERISTILNELTTIQARLEQFMKLLGSPSPSVGKYEALSMAGDFIDLCRKLDEGLRAIPSQLKD